MFSLAVPLAVLACCLGGALGGYVIARPAEALDHVGLAPAGGRSDGVGEARALGAMLLAAHAGTAGMLGYSPSIGANMALVLALAWGGSLAGRLLNSLRDGPGEGRGLRALPFEAMMAVTLALPFWVARNGFGGPTYSI